MAVEGFLPPVGNIPALWRYLQLRDVGAPTAPPVPQALTQLPLANDTIDTITWGYTEITREDFLHADGFVLYFGVDDSFVAAFPTASQVLLSPQARSHQMTWPNDAVRSYAIAAFRLTYAGLSIGPAQQVDSWTNVTG